MAAWNLNRRWRNFNVMEKIDKQAIFSCTATQLASYRKYFQPGEFSKVMRQLADAAVLLRIKKRGKA